MTTASPPELETEVRITSDGTARIILRGRLDAKTVAGCWNDLGPLRLASINKIEIEASDMRSCDSSGIALLPSWLVLPDIQSGRLTKLFEDYEVNPNNAQSSVTALYLPNHRGSKRVKAFIDLLLTTAMAWT